MSCETYVRIVFECNYRLSKRALRKESSIMLGGRRGGGYGPIFILRASAPSFSRTNAAPAERAANAMEYLFGAARANAATA